MKKLFNESRILILTALIGVMLWSGNAFSTTVTAQAGSAAGSVGTASGAAVAGTGMATLKVPSCPAKPRIFAEVTRKTPDTAPAGRLLVAREVNLWIESSEPQGLKLWVRHNFKTGRKEFVCANLPAQVQENFSVPILVLHDKSMKASTGDSVWQMQVMLRDQEMGLWNQKSGLLKSDLLLGADAKSLWFNVFTGEKLFFNERRSGVYKIQSLVDFDPSI